MEENKDVIGDFIKELDSFQALVDKYGAIHRMLVQKQLGNERTDQLKNIMQEIAKSIENRFVKYNLKHLEGIAILLTLMSSYLKENVDRLKAALQEPEKPKITLVEDPT